MTTPPPPPAPEPEPIPGNIGLVYPQNDDDKTMALIAHVGSIFVGFWAPLLILLIKKDSAFAQQESKEALNFNILAFLLALVTCGLFWFVAIVFYIMAAVKVNQGQPYRYPFNWRIIN